MRFLGLLRKEEDYSFLFAQQAIQIAAATGELVEMFNDKRDDYATHAARIKGIEHACDELTHRVIRKLNESFITPFDREDIYKLSVALDDVVDLIDSAARAMVIYEVHGPTVQARHLASVLQLMAVEIGEVISTLERPRDITRRLVEMHRLENEGDETYESALRELFRPQSSPLTVIKWKAIYDELESAIDRGERVATIIESMMIKST